MIRRITEREYWIVGTDAPQSGYLEPYLTGQVQTTNRNIPIYVYASGGKARVVRPRQYVDNVTIPRLGPDEDIGSKLSLAPLTEPQFAALRSKYMNEKIRPATPACSFGVLVDGKLVGAYALVFQAHFTVEGWVSRGLEEPRAYLLSDFPVAPTKHRRLAKLVLLAAVSREGQLLAERYGHKRIRSLISTAFSQKAVSMKYRGVFEILSRKESTVEGARFMLNYGSRVGGHTLGESLALWKSKWAGSSKDEGAA